MNKQLTTKQEIFLDNLIDCEGDAKKAAEEVLKPLTKMQLDIWGCKYHDLILGKPSGDYYIDDKGIKDAEFFNYELRP